MIYFFALLATVAVFLLWRLVVALWTILAQLGALARLGVDVHNAWNARANMHDNAPTVDAVREVFKS